MAHNPEVVGSSPASATIKTAVFTTKTAVFLTFWPVLDDLVFFVTLGIILGGRLGYVLFYGEEYFYKNPLQIFAVWNGGMSFHGGVIGVIASLMFYAKKYNIAFLKITDLVALYTPIGIFLGRLTNFINDELWGRVTNVSWAVKFPSGGYLPRHP